MSQAQRKTKPRPGDSVDAATARLIATRCFGAPGEVERIPSFNNRVFRLSYPGRTDRIVKLAKPDAIDPAMVREPQVMALLRMNGLQVPQVEFEDLSGELLGRPWFVMRSSGKRTASDLGGLSQHNRRALYRNVGLALASIHSIPFNAAADFDGRQIVHARFDRSPLIDWYRQEMRYVLEHRLLPEGDCVDLDTRLNDLPAPGPAALCHGDFNPSQCVRVGPKVAAIVDWEQAYVGDPLFDYAVYDLILDIVAPADLANQSRIAYRSVRSLPDDYEERFLGLKMGHALAMVATYHQTRRDGSLRVAKSVFRRLARDAGARAA